MKQLSLSTTLILIDIQKGFDDPKWGERNNPQAELNAAKLLAAWRNTGRPVIHIQHLSQSPTSLLRPNYVGSEFKEIVKPQEGERIIQKNVNSAFIGTDLESILRANNSNELVIAGLTTPHCVSTTVRMAGNLGFTTYLASDATASFNQTGPDGKTYKADDVHNYALASLHDEFATVLNVKKILSIAV